VVGVVNAIDSDVGYNGLVQYTIQNSSQSAFGIQLFTGEVFVQSSLSAIIQNYRLGPRTRANPLLVDSVEVMLEIVATDSTLRPESRKSSTTSVKIKIHSANVHAPVFDKASYRVRVKENNAPGLELLQLRAEDRDIGRNGKVEYKLATDNDGMLAIDPDTGVLRLDKSLDREQFSTVSHDSSTTILTSSYRILAIASDRGQPSKVTFVNIELHLEDENDNAPRCLRDVDKVMNYI